MLRYFVNTTRFNVDALAALAATASFAQSSVTIYGGLDVGVAKIKGGETGVNNTSYVVPASQSGTALANTFARTGLTANFLGFRGTEDLGGGMRAFFDLQTGVLDMSTGSTAVNFSRESHLGLAGGFGSIKMGRSVSTMCSVGCGFDANLIGNGSALAVLGLSPASFKASSRRSNQIEWTTPTLVPGLTTRVATILKGDAVEDSTFSQTLGSATAGRAYKNVGVLGLNYEQGALSLAYAYETANSNNTATRPAQYAAARYNFGPVIAGLHYAVNDTKGTSSTVGTTAWHSAAGATSGKGYALSLAAPIGAATVGLQYADNTENKTKATELFARYALSKRTQAYAYYTTTSGVTNKGETALISGTTALPSGTVTNNLNALGVSAVQANPTILGLGVRHTF